MTPEAWADLDEDEPGELIDGWLVEEELPTHPHEAVVAWLMWVLGGWARQRDALVFASEHKLAVAPSRGRKPDVCVYPPGTHLGRGALSRTPPWLVVEVLSPRPRDVRRDRHDKRVDYAQFGVRSYWLLDPQVRLLEVLELGPEGRYIAALSATEGQVRVPGFDDLVLDLDQLWAEVDRVIGHEGVEEDEAAEGDDPG
jgi:Uma2 family endonuclease